MKDARKREGQLKIEFFEARKRDVELEQPEAVSLGTKISSKEREDRFRALVTASSEVYYRMSPDWSEMHHFPSRGVLENMEMQNSNWLQEYIYPDDQPHMKSVINQAIRMKNIFELEYRVPRADGSFGWLFLRADPMLDANGEIIEWVCAASDITERKRSEQALKEMNATLEQCVADRTQELRKSETKYRQIVETSQEGIWVIGKGDRTVFINQKMADLLGYSIEEMLGRSPKEFMAPEFLEKADNCLHGHVYGVNSLIDYRFIRKDGSNLWCILSSCALYNDRGKLTGSLTMVTDITERKKAEEKLYKYQQHLEELVNDRTIELEIQSRKLMKVIADREKAEGEKRKVEAQLAQAQRIEALDRFAGGIAHDLNNILSPIIINTESLLENEPHDSIRRDILDETLRAAYRQRDLVRKILAFGRRNEQVLKPIQLRQLLEETLNFLRSSLPSTIRIQQNIRSQSDAIIGDPIQIQQVVMNLCKNAADALEEQKGIIEVKLTNTHITSEHGHLGLQAGIYLKLAVRDTGIGMDPAMIERIFDPFFTTKGVGKGTGMGLSIAYGIIKSHGGAITVESQVGKGSLFKVYLPLIEDGYKDQPPHGDPALPDQRKEKILLVDDEEIIISSLQRSLKNAGYQVISSMSSTEAINLFSRKSDEFDLVITDMTMPGMTGVELSRKIQSMRPDIPIILCTGFNDAISQQEAEQNGIKHLLLKPVGAGELKRTIDRVLVN